MSPQCIQDQPCTSCLTMWLAIAGIIGVVVLGLLMGRAVRSLRELTARRAEDLKLKREQEEREAAVRRAEATPYRGPTPATATFVRSRASSKLPYALLLLLAAFTTLISAMTR